MTRWSDIPEPDRQVFARYLRPGESIRRPKRGWVPVERVVAVYIEQVHLQPGPWQAQQATARILRIGPDHVRRILRRCGLTRRRKPSML